FDEISGGVRGCGSVFRRSAGWFGADRTGCLADGGWDLYDRPFSVQRWGDDRPSAAALPDAGEVAPGCGGTRGQCRATAAWDGGRRALAAQSVVLECAVCAGRDSGYHEVLPDSAGRYWPWDVEQAVGWIA